MLNEVIFKSICKETNLESIKDLVVTKNKRINQIKDIQGKAHESFYETVNGIWEQWSEIDLLSIFVNQNGLEHIETDTQAPLVQLLADTLSNAISTAIATSKSVNEVVKSTTPSKTKITVPNGVKDFTKKTIDEIAKYENAINKESFISRYIRAKETQSYQSKNTSVNGYVNQILIEQCLYLFDLRNKSRIGAAKAIAFSKRNNMIIPKIELFSLSKGREEFDAMSNKAHWGTSTQNRTSRTI